MRFQDSHGRKLGEIFGFEVLRTSKTRRMGRAFVGTTHGLAHAADELFELRLSFRKAGNSNPGLIIAGTGGVHDESSRSDAVQLIRFQIIKLDETDTVTDRADD